MYKRIAAVAVINVVSRLPNLAIIRLALKGPL